MYVHTGSWPFKCDICHRGFSKQTNLKNHMQMHSSEEKQTDNRQQQHQGKNKNLSPVLTDYLIGLTNQNNNIEEKKETEAALKLFRPINF